VTAGCVLDASVVARWIVGDPGEPLTIAARAMREEVRLRRTEAHVPELLFPEVGNVLWKAVRFSGHDRGAAVSALATLPELGLQIHPHGPIASLALELACQRGISVYDSTYVVLARVLGLPLITADLRLVRAMAAADVVPLA
jgi:predicted nucleic acid-binding protein